MTNLKNSTFSVPSKSPQNPLRMRYPYRRDTEPIAKEWNLKNSTFLKRTRQRNKPLISCRREENSVTLQAGN